MKIQIIIVFTTILLFISGCSDNSTQNIAKPLAKEIEAEAKQRSRTKYLAYEHKVAVTIAEKIIQKIYEKIIDSCANDNEYNCTILQSNLSTGRHATGEIKLRIKPEGVSHFLALASENGSITRQSTRVEDLSEVIIESEKRLEMLEAYREKLEELEQKSNNDIEALIKIASELSTVQSNIEYAFGAKANLLQRVKMDIVHINLHTPLHESFWLPISTASNNFGGNLSDGISQTITVLAYLLPWLFILYLVVYGVRYVWRRGKTKS